MLRLDILTLQNCPLPYINVTAKRKPPCYTETVGGRKQYEETASRVQSKFDRRNRTVRVVGRDCGVIGCLIRKRVLRRKRGWATEFFIENHAEMLFMVWVWIGLLVCRLWERRGCSG